MTTTVILISLNVVVMSAEAPYSLFSRVVHSWHFSVNSHDSEYFSLLFSFILINSGNEKIRMKKKKI